MQRSFSTFIKSSFIAMLIVFLSGCSLFQDEEDKTISWSANKLYTEASTSLAEGDYETAIKYYELLQARYPFGPQSKQAQLDVGYAYYKHDEPESALAAMDRFIKLNPDSKFLPYAYYLKGIVNFNRNMGFIQRFVPTDTSQRDPQSSIDSFSDFDTLIRRFPDSQYADDARKRLLYLRNNIARHEIHVAKYYMKRGAYIAAANRGQYVIKHYQKSPSVKDALIITIEAYKKLNMPELADDYERILAFNADNGSLLRHTDEESDQSLVEDIWDYIGLDEG